jgi:putative Ig domain-containing protein
MSHKLYVVGRMCNGSEHRAWQTINEFTNPRGGLYMFRNRFNSFGLRSSAAVSLSAITLFAMLSLSGCGGNSTPPAMSVTVTSSAATVDATDSVTLAATVANDKTPGGVTWAVTGGGTLSNTSTTGATYTAPAASSSAVTATVTATSVADTTKTGTMTLTVPPTPTITTGPLTANVGTAFSATLAGAGGIAPYKWALTSGTLPTGWSLTSAGLLSGPAPMAAEAGSTNLTFGLTDSGTATPATASQQLALTINPAPAIVFTSSSVNGTFNAAYSATVTATGGAGTLTYTLASGHLPTGLTLSAAGVIAGMPTVAGTFPITVKAADAFGDSAISSVYSITVSYPQLKVTAATLPTGYVGSTYTATTLQATGGSSSGYTWALATGSALPAGLTLSPLGVITGKPTATTPASFTATVTDSASNTANGTFSITVDAALTITTATTLPTAYVGSSYSQTLAATGGSGTGYTWALQSGSTLPAGLTLSGGVISGKPTTAGAPSFTVIVTDSVGNTATATFTVTISAGVSITSSSTLPAGYQGTAYPGATLTATGGSGTGFTWTWAAAGGSTLPAGLTLSAGGAVSGIPTGSGASSIVVTVKDSVGNTASATDSLTVQATLAISSGATLPAGVVATAYSDTLAATGGSGGYVWSTNSAGTTSLAAIGLSFSGGVVSGASPTLGTATFTGTVTDSASHTASLTFSVTVSNLLTVTTNSLPAAYAGTAYSQTLAAAGGSGTGYKWALQTGSALPAGLTLSSGGLLSGTPAASGTASFTVKVTDSASNSATQAFTFAVYNALSLPAPNPNSLGAATTSVAYTGTISASGGSGNYAWTVTGLPSDSLSSSPSGGTLTISGTPTTVATVTFGVKLTDTTTNVSITQTGYTILVSNALTVTTTSLPAAYAGTAYSQTLAAAGGSGTGYKWALQTGSALPAGLTLSSGGLLSGTPATSGTASFTVKVTDSASNTATQPFSFAVYNALSLPAPNPNSLGAGTTSEAYSGSISASGGSGNYAWTVTGLPSDGLSSSPNGGTLNISGTPTTAVTVQFGVSVKDTTTGVTVGPFTYSILVSNPPPLTLPTPNPSSLPSATVNQSYSGSVTAAGGAGTYTWTVNGSVLSSGTTGLGNGNLSVSANGNSLTITGTPTTTTTSGSPISFTASVADSVGQSTATDTYTLAVNNLATISGQFFLPNYCSNGSSNLPVTFTVGLYNGATLVQSTTTDVNGNYSFTSIPNGTYSITPSLSGAATLFYPTSITGLAVNTSSNNNVQGQNFNANVGFTVSGNVTYSGSQTGQTYLVVNNNSCGGNQGTGTSITEAKLTSGGAFTIRGVPPGSNTIQAWMDPLGQSVQNAIDPTGSVTVTVDGNVSNADLTMADPAFLTPSENPKISTIIPNAQGVFIEGSPSKNSNGEEDANQYLVQWSTSPTLGGGTGGDQFATIAGSHTFTASGKNGIWILNNAVLTGSGFTFTSGQTYYFQARSFDTLASTTHPSGWCNYTSTGCSGTSGFVGVTIAAPACTGTCTAVSSSVTIPAGITINSGAPLYLGMVQQSNEGGNPTGIYVIEIANPVHGANAFTVTVPSGPNYAVVGILDQDKTGGIGAGTVSNTNNVQANLTISGSTQTVPGVTLPTGNSTATVSTQWSSNICCGGTTASTTYALNFDVRESSKLPVAVTLTSGPNMINTGGTVAIDFGNSCNNCGNTQFQYSVTLPGGTPNVGDKYDFTVTYSDGSQDTGSTVNAAVTGWDGGTTIVGPSDAPTNFAPINNNSTSTTPTFTWTDSSSSTGSDFEYSFYLSNNSTCSGNCTIWQIPGQNSNANGFSSSITSITWYIDPTDSTNTPSVGSLTPGDIYGWQISVQDPNNNQAQMSVWYQP